MACSFTSSAVLEPEVTCYEQQVAASQRGGEAALWSPGLGSCGKEAEEADCQDGKMVTDRSATVLQVPTWLGPSQEG